MNGVRREDIARMQVVRRTNDLIMEYLVKVSKRRAFWSLNEDILKINILKTNTPYPSRKIRRICACTHQRPRGIKLNTSYPEDQYAVLEFWNQYNILEDIKRGPYSKKSPTRRKTYQSYNDINIELIKEFLVELRKNIYHGMYNEDMMDHIAKVLKMVDLIYVPGLDSHQLQMKVFPLSLADDAKEWWISDGDEKITTWEELVEKFFCRFYPESYHGEDEMLDEGENLGIDPLEFLSNVNISFKNHKKVDGRTQKESKYENPPNTATDSFFKAYEARDIEKQSQTKRKYNNTSNSINEQPNKRRYKAEKFEAIQYSLGPNEEYIAIRSYEYDI
ncbi:hypothetical protein Tco_1089414 [Tanacetum coccineum]